MVSMHIGVFPIKKNVAKQQFPPVAYKDPVSLNFINIEYYKNNCFYDGLKMALVLKVPFFDLLRS